MNSDSGDTIKLTREQTEFLRKALADPPQKSEQTQFIKRRSDDAKKNSAANSEKLKIQPL